ncbi:LLM class flavin-dependent oxidoreductase [Paractinoplanes atraurantiacus]|uniref:Luciferase-like monooxygenase n=1 Tax=Paractinoplanes atraurantiacus TaxID=1036182 RepID=A0A285JYE0_9ACTN|nr:LLM class flavin-dependent oxidoreductase [Actinoplanes atraurantiacus]SNY65362.1 Luciferase-like monooxygenase [Actinoplanes atraurantiacus]
MSIHLALEIDGAGSHPGARGGLPDTEAVAVAEAAGFALITINDSPLSPSPEAGVRASHLARRTRRIGLAPTLHPALTEPFHLATQLAALDHASQGRGAWVVGAENSAAAHATIGGKPLSDDALRREISDVIDVARLLWDSWEDDAVIRDVASGRFLDPDRVHHVNFTGERFSVVGPLITPRPPQGQLVVIAAADISDKSDVALVAAPTIDELAARAKQTNVPRVFAEVEVLLGEDRLAELDAREPWGEPARLRFAGDAEEFRALLATLDGIVDGVRLHPAVLEIDLPRLAVATRRGPVGGPTLRDTLGLPRPVNVFAGEP